MTTTPPYPEESDEPEDARDEAQQALDGLHSRPRQDESGQTAYAAVPPPLGDPPEGSMTGPADWQSFDRPAERTFGQGPNPQIGQPDPQQGQFGQQFGQPYGQPSGQPGAQPLLPQYGQPGAQHFTQPPGRQQFADQSAGAEPAYAPYPGALMPEGRQPGVDYGQGPAGPAAMPPYAGWWKRVGASLLDNVLVSVALGLIVEPSNSSVLEGISGVLGFVWSLYNAFLAGRTGQSYGKRAVGIRLARMEDGRPVGGGYGLLRWLMNDVLVLLCFVPGLLNYLWPLWDSKHQTFSDKIADSVVVRA